MENRSFAWAAMLAAGLVGGFCAGQWYEPPNGGGVQCTTCCLTEVNWYRSQLPDGSLRFVNRSASCTNVEWMLHDSASTDPGNHTYQLMSDDSASTDPGGNFVAESIAVYGSFTAR